MRELAQHITDLVENSARAGARKVTVELEKDGDGWLTLRVSDDGSGMSREEAIRAVDPFWTSRTCRRVGLGLPLLAATAQRCGGSLEIESEPGAGTRITARWRDEHIDAPPLGDLHATLISALVGHPEMDLTFRKSENGRLVQIDGAEIRRELGDVPITHPLILGWLERHVQDLLAEGETDGKAD